MVGFSSLTPGVPVLRARRSSCTLATAFTTAQQESPERRAICQCKTESMSSGFVSGGTADKPIERSDEWLAAQKELEANRAQRAAAAKQPDGRSLYETLEANKGTSYKQLS